MKAWYYILGAILLIAGTGCGVYVVISAVTHAQGLTTLKELVPALVFHTVVMFLGMILIFLGQRYQKSG